MKRFVLGFFAVALIASGCHAQVPQSAPKYQCPPTTSTAWAPLNPVGSTSNPPTSSLSYVDKPAAGQWCYNVVAYDPTSTSQTYQMYSLPSNVTQITFTSSNTSVTNTWSASTTLSVVYVMSRAPATLIAPPGAPALNSPTVAMDLKPALPEVKPAEPMTAMIETPKLASSVR